MIVTEFYRTREDGVNLYRTYSDEGFYIIQNETGAKYEEAIDVEGAGYTYTETNEKIPEPDFPFDPIPEIEPEEPEIIEEE